MEQILQELTLPELFALHNKLDKEIAATRETQALVDKVIRSKELATMKPGPAHLAQSTFHG